MNKLIILVYIFLSSLISVAQDNLSLSSNAEISLLTCTPGDELYALFGHSAMRVVDPQNKIDAVFNYGTFSFDKDFYYNFTMGKLNYMLSISSMENFVSSYEYEGRGMTEQILNLDSSQRQAVFDFLIWNARPENKYYPYDFFYDNCSSRLRDVLVGVAGDDGLVFPDLKRGDDLTFRNLIDAYLIYHPWGDFGIDLGLGMPCDKVVESREYMFLPDELYNAYAGATLGGEKLVKTERVILEAGPQSYAFSMTDPVPLMWLLLGVVLLISALGYRKGRIFKGLDVLILTVYGAVGALVFFLWFITDHNGTVNNLNILWAWPVHIPAISLLWFKNTRKWYWQAYGAVLFITLLAFPLLPQALHAAVVPLILIGIIRAFVNIKIT